MKCQILFSWKNKKNTINLLSAEFAQRVVTVNPGSTGIFFLFLHKNVCCEYLLEATRQGASNEYHKRYFHGEI